jgi:hypothetical protein
MIFRSLCIVASPCSPLPRRQLTKALDLAIAAGEACWRGPSPLDQNAVEQLSGASLEFTLITEIPRLERGGGGARTRDDNRLAARSRSIGQGNTDGVTVAGSPTSRKVLDHRLSEIRTQEAWVSRSTQLMCPCS